MEPIEHSSSSNNSIEEDIVEAVETENSQSDSLPLPLGDNTESNPPSVEQDSTSNYSVPIPIEEKSTTDDQFKIDPDQLFGDNLLKHFKPPDPEDFLHDDQSTTQDISDLKDEDTHDDTLKAEDIEKDNSIQEITVSNHSIEMTFEADSDFSGLHPHIDIDNESHINKLLSSPKSPSSSARDDEDLAALKERIQMLKDMQKPLVTKSLLLSDDNEIVVKQMERITSDFSKEALEDITEESYSGNYDSVVSLNMIKALEARNEELVEIVAAKDLCMTALNMQLDMAQRRESYVTNESYQPSGRESLITTTSTEYRTFADDFYGKNNDLYLEIVERDNLITQLKESLQKSLQAREDLDVRTSNLTSEVQQLRRQIQEIVESKRSQIWRRGGGDQESVGQRLSEISMELVSETDDDIENPLLTDNEDRVSRSSRERQLSRPPEMEFVPINKELEEFQDSLAHFEIPIYYAIRRKFDDFISQELEKLRQNYESERKIAIDRVQAEKNELNSEVERLQNVLQTMKSGSSDLDAMKKELDVIHSKEMEELRQYFEKKCAELEKQYSEEVFSQKSHRNGSSCDSSDQEELPIESKETSPRKKSKESLYSSPSHRQITPNQDSDEETMKEKEIKEFYMEKISELNRTYENTLKQISSKLKRYENKYGGLEFLSETEKDAENNMSTFLIIDQDELSKNDTQVIQKIIDDYERRLQEQIALAKQDFVTELENQFQAFLTETSSDDHWPSEFVLLREKFTAKHQLEIAQIELKHEEEMTKMKADFEKQLTRKSKRQFTFDLSRDLDCILSERDGLRELSSTFRTVLSELAKCVCVCEDDLNLTFLEEIQKISDVTMNDSLQSSANTTKRFRLAPDVSGLLSVVDDPRLLGFISEKVIEEEKEDFDLKDCIERLRSEAEYLYELSENLNKRHQQDKQSETTTDGERNDSCEEEDGLKSASKRTPHQIKRAQSLNETPSVCRRKLSMPTQSSLPPDLNRVALNFDSTFDVNFSSESVSELNFHVNELRNRLVQSENIRAELTERLQASVQENKELEHELDNLRKQLDQLDSHREDYKGGYALGVISSPERRKAAKNATSFTQLQEKARNLLGTPIKPTEDETINLLQMIEDFCREGDRVVESSKTDRDELQLQLAAADKQLKGIKQFMDSQAIDREFERDKYIKEIDDLKARLTEKDKFKTSYENVRKENEVLEQQLKEVTQQNVEYKERKVLLERELKQSIDKVFDLREMICNLESQVQEKGINEFALEEEVKHLKAFINTQTLSNDTLQHEVDALRQDIAEGYEKRLSDLEEQLRNYRPSKEQCAEIDQICDQLLDIEATLEQKIKTLESLHHNSASPVSSRSTAAEDVSVEQAKVSADNLRHGSSEHPSPRLSPPLHLEPLIKQAIAIQRVFEKLGKHTRAEEAAIKRIRDLEMQVDQIRNISLEIQNQRDNLQEKMNEQMQRISSLSAKLEEQRHRAEELQRQGTSTLTLRNHDLQNDVRDLKETLSARDKQINTLKGKLEETKEVLDRQDAELNTKSDRSLIEKLQKDLATKEKEISKLKEKMKSEMINKLALPDLMETILAEKNEEIDHLKEQLDSKEKELQNILEMDNISQASLPKSQREEDFGKSSARTLSDIVSISEYSAPDVIRRAHLQESPLVLPDNQPFSATMDTSKEAIANLTEKRTSDLNVFANLHPASTFENPHYFQDPSVPIQGINSSSLIISAVAPRKINFSNLTDDSRKMDHDETVEVNKLREEVESLKLKLEELGNEKDLEIKSLTQQLKEHLESYNDLKKETDELMEKRSSLENRLELYDANVLKIGQLQDELDTKVVELKELNVKLLNIQKDLQNKEDTIKKLNEQLCHFTEFSEEMQDQFAGKDAVIKKLQENLTDLEKISGNKEKYSIELNSARAELYSTREELTEKTADHNRLLIEVKTLMLKIDSMQKEIERLRSQNSECSKPYSIDELAEQVEKELNYSAQLDSNILKAIESEEENNFDAPEPTELEKLRSQLLVQQKENEDLIEELNREKQSCQEIQEQDVAIIQAMRLRLEDCMEKEQDLHKLLDDEREKCERLATQISILQRSEARRASLLLKSPPDSPRKSPRSYDFEMDLADRLRSEIKLLTSQNERERERISDLQKNLEKEKSRFETELQDRIEYSEKLSREMDKMAREKDSAEQEIEHLQDRLTIQNSEIETLEKRIATFQENETRRASRRDKELAINTKDKVELQELKAKLLTLEAERDQLLKSVSLLRTDVSRGAERETRLAEAVANASGSAQIPQKIITRMKEMNDMLSENHKENKQMADTVQFLIEERRTLQRKYDDLEKNVASGSNCGKTNAQLEERVNYLLGRYLRVESYRKSLVHQKRYLQVALRCYQESEARAVALIGGNICSMYDSLQQDKKRKSFKTVALAVIAIRRMEFLVRRWYNPGKRIVSKSVYTLTQQKPSTSSSNNNQNHFISTSPPCRDNSSHRQPIQTAFTLKSPALITECDQKFHWSRLKKQ
ncbi:AKAP9 family protein [Megaselia abdita]